MTNVWAYREDIYERGTNLAGFDVEATDGSIGSVDEDSTDVDHLIVDTGFWIFGKRRLLPAGVIERIDYDNEMVYLSLTKEQIKAAPDLDDSSDSSDQRRGDWDRSSFDSYYGPYGW